MTESESEYSSSSSEEELDVNNSHEGEVESICIAYQDEPLADID
jgi:hypothetical protein